MSKVCGNCRVRLIHLYSGEKWERYTCKECGSKHIAGDIAVDRVYHIVCEKGDISTGARTPGMWTVERVSEGLVVYVTCPSCNRINSGWANTVNSEGFMGGRHRNTCLTCECGYHFWPFLEGWNEEERKKSGVPKKIR